MVVRNYFKPSVNPKLLLSWLLSCVLSFTVNAQKAPVLKVSLPSFAPFAFIDKEGSLDGAVIRLYQKLSVETGITIEVIMMPYARLLRELQSGNLDLAIIFKNNTVEDHVAYFGPISLSKVIVITKAENPLGHYAELSSLIPILLNIQSFSGS